MFSRFISVDFCFPPVGREASWAVNCIDCRCTRRRPTPDGLTLSERGQRARAHSDHEHPLEQRSRSLASQTSPPLLSASAAMTAIAAATRTLSVLLISVCVVVDSLRNGRFPCHMTPQLFVSAWPTSWGSACYTALFPLVVGISRITGLLAVFS